MLNKYLTEARSFLALKEPLLGVIGNESCDLDSAICAISLAFFLFKNSKSSLIPQQTPKFVLPILNIPRAELPLKTEVVHLLNSHNISLEDLVCRDEIELKKLIDGELLDLILVDHHVSPYRNRVVSVIDHRPFDLKSNLNPNCKNYITDVGSCATLVTDIIRKDVDLETTQEYNQILRLLYATTILDTINFSKNADKARPLDHEITEFLENYLKIENPLEHRKNLFEELVKARADVSSLNSLQILSKDLKIISNHEGSLRVAIPGYPILVQDYIKLPDAEENLKVFAETNNLDVVCLMGMKCIDHTCKRDLGIVNIKNENLTMEILETLKTLKAPDLSLTQHTDIKFLDGHFFKQSNVKASRKQILPVITKILEEFKD